MIIGEKVILESEISDIIKKDNNCNTHFDYIKDNDNYSIRVTTYNPIKKETFLLIEIPCIDFIYGLKQVKEWVLSHNIGTGEVSHTILWTKIGDSHTYMSHFYAKNVRKALDKFFYDKDESKYIVYEIKMNPIS